MFDQAWRVSLMSMFVASCPAIVSFWAMRSFSF